MSNNPRWKYQDAIGITREGTYEGHRAGQGSDVTYFFRRDDGTLDLVSGSRLKAAERLWPSAERNYTPSQVYRAP